MEWRAFDLLEPIGGRRDDWHAASICATVMNAMLISRGSRRRVKVQDFLLEFDRAGSATTTSGKQTWQQQKMIAQMFVAMSKADQRRAAKRKAQQQSATRKRTKRR